VLGGLQALPAQKMIPRGEVVDRAVEALQKVSGPRHQPVAGARGRQLAQKRWSCSGAISGR